MAKFNPLIQQIVNVMIVLLGCALIALMWDHQSIEMYFWKGAELPRGFYLFLNPYIKIGYGAGAILLIAKEFFLKKPIRYKIKFNALAAIALFVALATQIGVWQYAIGTLSAH